MSETDQIVHRLDVLEAKVDRLLDFAAKMDALADQLAGVLEGVENSPVGRMLAGQMGIS